MDCFPRRLVLGDFCCSSPALVAELVEVSLREDPIAFLRDRGQPGLPLIRDAVQQLASVAELRHATYLEPQKRIFIVQELRLHI